MQIRQYDIIVRIRIIYYNFVLYFCVITLLFQNGLAGDLTFARMDRSVALGIRHRQSGELGFLYGKPDVRCLIRKMSLPGG